MTNKAKILWIGVGSLVVGGAIWLWWRQKDAVPVTAVPLMQQARMVITSTTTGGAGTAPAQSTGPGLQTTLESLIPGYIPLPTTS